MLALLGRLRFGQEGGAVVVMAALWIGFGLVPMLGLVVETGNWYEHKRHLQAQVDAAALAGGDLFGGCFNGSGGSTAMLNEATKYGGVRQGFFNGTGYPSVAYADTDIYNPQIGGDKKGTVTLRYQSKTYEGQPTTDTTPDDTETQDPCSTPSFMFDVKGTESNLPVFATWLPLIGGAGGGGNCGLGLLVCNINAHARIQLRGLSSASPSLPLAVPDINPKQVAVTFVDESTGNELSPCSGANKLSGTTCTFTLTKGAATGGINNWSGPASVTLPPAPVNVGVRVGLGANVGSCANTAGVGGQYGCYDNVNGKQGLFMIRDFAWGGTVSTAPIFDSVTPLTAATTATPSCSGSQYFALSSLGTATTCAAGVRAVVDFGTVSTTSPPDTSKYKLTATVDNADGKKASTVDMSPVAGSYDSAHHAWTWEAPVGSLALTPGVGTQPITLTWTVSKGTSPICPGTRDCTGKSSTGIHRFYSAPVDATGPVQKISITKSLSDASSLVGDGTTEHALSVSVGVSGSYSLHAACAPPPSGGSYACATDLATLIRFASVSGSRTYAVDCGTPAIPGGGGDLYKQILGGCANSYSVNGPGYCPDPSPPDPTDCVPIGNVGSGVKTGQVRAALNDRLVNNAPFNGVCAANNYPVVAPGDPRVFITMITDFSAFDGSGGSGSVPVITFGAFYLTGWDGAPPGCDNEPYSRTGTGGTSQNGDIWGHFIRYVAVGGGGGSVICDPSGILPCVPVLTQ